MSDKSICAVIVTYNRKILLKRCINKILEQSVVPAILVIDNCSADGTEEVVREMMRSGNIKYYKLSYNQGGAGGFAIGTRMAFEDGYEFIWLMDDDGYPYNSQTLQNIMQKVRKERNNFLIYNSLVVCNKNLDLCFTLFGKNKYSDMLKMQINGLVQGEINPFNGTLITREVIAEIGVPKAEFFIYGDEREYFLRAKKSGVKLATVVDSLYFHANAPVKEMKILWKKKYYREDKAWQIYYTKRNMAYITKSYFGTVQTLIFIRNSIFDFFTYRNDRLNKIKCHIKGIRDGLKSDFSVQGIWQ